MGVDAPSKSLQARPALKGRTLNSNVGRRSKENLANCFMPKLMHMCIKEAKEALENLGQGRRTHCAAKVSQEEEAQKFWLPRFP